MFRKILEYVKDAVKKVVSTAKKLLHLEEGEVTALEVLRVVGYATVAVSSGVLLSTSGVWLVALAAGCVIVLLCNNSEETEKCQEDPQNGTC